MFLNISCDISGVNDRMRCYPQSPTLEKPRMQLAIIGSGDMGSALAGAFSQRASHRISVRGSSSGSESAQRLVRSLGIREATRADAMEADALFLVVPWAALPNAAAEFTDYRGILVSVVVPWSADGAISPLNESAAELAARAMPHARVVCAFTTVSSSVVAAPGTTESTSVIACSDDPGACAVVMQLARDIGFEAYNGGGLRAARYAEAMGLLWASLAYEGGYGERVAFRVHIAD
jgi:8-hydroxy-5-deazaflavin:NADPH oxidoreductase